ncbi:MAG: hypothetical protein AB1758_36975 [Candidatus Eremiobacterota bacterium]
MARPQPRAAERKRQERIRKASGLLELGMPGHALEILEPLRDRFPDDRQEEAGLWLARWELEQPGRPAQDGLRRLLGRS